MGDPIVTRLKALLENPLGCYPNPATLIDTYIIVCLKIEHAPTPQLEEEKEELERRLRRHFKGVSNKDKLLELVTRLTAFHRDMWLMEDQIRDPALPPFMRRQTAFEADMKNDERARLKTEINELFHLKPGSEAKIRSA